jgi:gamma-glutamylaminecyclotransferase
MSRLRVSTRIIEIPVFVYGTLLRGEANHDRLTGCRFGGDARTAPLFSLLDLGPYPALVTGGVTAVAGELYLVPPQRLEELDRFEGHPALYLRSRIRLERGFAQAYLASTGRIMTGRAIAGGDWRRRHLQGPA